MAGSYTPFALRDVPGGEAPARGVAVIAHPHPLFGGTMDNKVVQTLARAFVQLGYRAVRFNFRGVGRSQGPFDHGTGELSDSEAFLYSLILLVAGNETTTNLLGMLLMHLARDPELFEELKADFELTTKLWDYYMEFEHGRDTLGNYFSITASGRLTEGDTLEA